MGEFPWSALLTGVFGIALGLLPLIAGLTVDARLESTVKLLERLGNVHPNSSAVVALRDTVDLLAARRFARLAHGSGQWFYFAAVIMTSLWVGSWNGAIELNAQNQWLSGLSALAFLTFSAWRYYKFGSAVEEALRGGKPEKQGTAKPKV